MKVRTPGITLAGTCFRHFQVSQVPENPQNQAKEDEDGSWKDEEIPVAQWGKDSNEEEDEAYHIQEDGKDEK